MIHWDDGTNEQADMRTLRHVTLVDESRAPGTLLRKPEPVTVFMAQDDAKESLMSRTLMTRKDIMARLDYTMPGKNKSVHLDSMLAKVPAYNLPPTQGVAQVKDIMALFHVLRMDKIGTILDPWGDNRRTAMALHELPRPIPKLILNVFGKIDRRAEKHVLDNGTWETTAVDPLSVACVNLLDDYKKHPNVIVSSPPPELLELSLPLLTEANSALACIFVPKASLSSANLSLFTYLHYLQLEGKVVRIDPYCAQSGDAPDEPSSTDHYCWLCIAPHAWHLSTIIRVPKLLPLDAIRVAGGEGEKPLRW
jgi:hypothetical protein